MTHPSDATNGASLEDCHTNFFALADLSGIKWRRLCADCEPCYDPLDDPVLSSYTKCLSSGILCVWRRVLSPKTPFQNPNPLNNVSPLGSGKELWIFWYGEEPELSGLVGPNLIDTDQGSWETGLSYECRTLLFKALHNLIEKCLYTKGYTRLGHFFIDPQFSSHLDASRASQLAFSFNFFVHGESTVCTSIDVRLAPSVFRLRKCHLLSAQSEHNSVKVILSPYGLQGTLTGHSYRKSDPIASKILNEWYHFYPHPQRKDGSFSDIPAVVEVLVGGTRMKYPASYVYIVQEDYADDISGFKESGSNTKTLPSVLNTSKPCPSLSLLTPPTSPERNLEFREASRKTRTANLSRRSTIVNPFRNAFQDDSDKPSTPSIVKLSVRQENSVIHSCDTSNDSTILWDFQEPSKITKCGCSKKNASANDVPRNLLETDATFGISLMLAKNEKTQSSAHYTPFHKRTLQRAADVSSLFDAQNFQNNDVGALMVNSYNNSQNKGSSNTSGAASVSGGLITLPQLHTPITQPSSVDSHSNVPSVETSCSQICSSDPIMPTLSPHPPVIKEEQMPTSENRDVLFTHSPNTDIGPTINIKEKTVSDKLLPPSYKSLLNYFENAKDAEENSTNIEKSIQVNENLSGEPENSKSMDTQSKAFKRPILLEDSPNESDEDDIVMRGVCYNYDDMDSHISDLIPNKRRCIQLSDIVRDCQIDEHIYESDGKESMMECNSTFNLISKDPYEFTDFDDSTPSESFVRTPHLDIRIKEEKLSPCASPITPEVTPPSPRLQNLSVSEDIQVASCELPIPLPSPPSPKIGHQKFIREEDLTVTLHDLDNIFDTSSSDGDDMCLAPSTNKAFIAADELSLKSKTSGFLDLSRMFPTPPSLEQNATPSPLGTILADTEGMRDRDGMCGNLSIEIKDWTVFKLPDVHTFIESSKYSPLAGLSSSAGLLKIREDYIYKPIRQFDNFAGNLSLISSFNSVQGKAYYGQSNKYFSTADEEDAYNSQYILNHSQDEHFMLNTCDMNSPSSIVSPFISKHLGSAEESSVPPPLPDAHCLLVNLLLSDSMLNIFKDHNFDSCALCVCNMNIKGADVGINLPDSLVPSGTDEPQYKCTCGFSAVIHRHRSYGAGLFHEDEFQIFGFNCDENFAKRYGGSALNSALIKVDSKKPLHQVPAQISPAIVDLIRVQCKSLFSSFSLFKKPNLGLCTKRPMQFNAVEIHDGCEICSMALELGKGAMDNTSNCKLDEMQKQTCLHRWPYTYKTLPPSNHEVMLHLDFLKPILQEAVHKRNTQRMWEITYAVSGPLTWREFHRLAARGNEDQCELQPIPSVTVGHDKDYVSLSPFSLKFWDKLLLEPYCLPRDVAYIVVAPENDFVLTNVKAFFRELSSTYELYKLGRHSPITKVLRDGIMRVGKNAAMKLADEPVDEWFNQIEDSPLAAKLKLYARVCQYRLAPYLSTLPSDKTLLENMSPSKSSSEKVPVVSASPSHNESHDSSSKASSESATVLDSLNSANGSQSSELYEDDDQECPAIVIYIVEPFTFSSMEPDLCRLVTLGLLQSYSQMLKCLPSSLQNNINLQLLSLDSILYIDKLEKNVRKTDELKTLAFSVYNQCHRILPRQSSVKSLTGFGPAAAQDLFLHSKNDKTLNPFFAYNQPVILSSLKDKQTELNEMFGDGREKSGVLFCSYCLTEDKKWILISCTNDKGELIETNVINIATPVRSRQKCTGVRRYGLRKLLDFILEVLSNSVCPWRIVIGRLGKLGHGELKDWAALLSRKSLLSYSQQLRELCTQCSNMSNVDTPSIISVCLVSVFPDPALRIMPDQYTPDDHSSSSCNTCELSTPEDASCTHILVFPTSATMQSSQSSFHQENIVGGMEDEDLFDVFKDVDDDINVGQEMKEIFGWAESPNQSPSNSPHHGGASQPGSPSAGRRHSPFHQGGPNQSLTAAFETPDDPLQLLAQPLALGYYVSTAKTGPLPSWFWSSCPHLSNSLPVFLKFALLIHMPSIQQNSDDILHANTHQPNCHPLDSTYTSDVLRFVLEGYNALSWLSLDPASRDRTSCLPIHIQNLMQLYRIAENLM